MVNFNRIGPWIPQIPVTPTRPSANAVAPQSQTHIPNTPHDNSMDAIKKQA